MEIGEEIMVLGLGLKGLRISWISCLGGWMLVLMVGLCLEWCLEMVWVRNRLIWWRFFGVMEVWRFLLMEVLERSLREERVVVIEWGRNFFFFEVMLSWWLRTAVPVLLPFFGFWLGWLGTTVPLQARAVPVIMVKGVKNFLFFRITFGQKPTKQIKTTQNKQK